MKFTIIFLVKLKIYWSILSCFSKIEEKYVIANSWRMSGMWLACRAPAQAGFTLPGSYQGHSFGAKIFLYLSLRISGICRKCGNPTKFFHTASSLCPTYTRWLPQHPCFVMTMFTCHRERLKGVWRYPSLGSAYTRRLFRLPWLTKTEFTCHCERSEAISIQFLLKHPSVGRPIHAGITTPSLARKDWLIIFLRS